MQEILEFVKVYGFPAVVVVYVLTQASKMGWKIICAWIDTMNASVLALETANKRWQIIVEADNMRWQAVIDKQTATIDRHTQDSREAHQYTRSEHKALEEQMRTTTETLGRINGYKDKEH